MHIGEKIKQRREELKWSQRDLADKMDYAHSTIGRIERGIIDIPQSKIAKFAKVLGVPVSYLMGWEEKPKEMAQIHVEMVMDEDLVELFEDFKQLDKKKKQMLKDLAHSWVETKSEV